MDNSRMIAHPLDGWEFLTLLTNIAEHSAWRQEVNEQSVIPAGRLEAPCAEYAARLTKPKGRVVYLTFGELRYALGMQDTPFD